MRNIYLLTIILLAQFINAQDRVFTPQSEIKKWRWGYHSAFSFTFDDGLLTQSQYAAPVLDEYGFKGTFYVLPPFLTETLPGIWRYGTWSQFQQVGWNGHEIGSHTLNHPYLTSLPAGDTLTPNTINYELYHSKKQIEQRLQKKCVSIAYPYSDHNSIVDSLTKLFYESGRSVGSLPNVGNNPSYYSLKSFPVTFSLPRNSASDDLDELNNFIQWTENSISDSAWGIIMIHEVVPFVQIADLINQGLYEPMSTEWLSLFCGWLETKGAESKVWVETTGNVIRYIRLRQNSVNEIISVTADEMRFRLMHNLDPQIYKYWLTVLVSVPDDWTTAYFKQGQVTDSLVIFESHLGRSVMHDVITDGSEYIISRSPVTGINDIASPEVTFELDQNFPNPFNPVTTISWRTNKTEHQILKVFDILGNEIRVLMNETLPAGKHKIEFDGSDLPSGVYIYTLMTEEKVYSKKMLMIK